MEERERGADRSQADIQHDTEAGPRDPQRHATDAASGREKRVMASAEKVMRKHRTTFAALAK